MPENENIEKAKNNSALRFYMIYQINQNCPMHCLSCVIEVHIIRLGMFI